MKSAVGAAQITGIDPQIASIVPRRIILSRKGWDSKAGGWPNPILPGGHPLSLPIPDSNSGVTYGDLYLPDGRKLVGEMVRQLSNGKWGPDDELHLDPDIRQNAVKRNEFRAAFGQCGGAQTHLTKQKVCSGPSAESNDLFLYFGRYREVEEQSGRWRYRRRGPEIQLIFGWLQISEMISLADGRPEWAQSHPHCRLSGIVQAELGKRKVNNNTLYVARRELSFSSKPGAGVFQRFDTRTPDPKRLTREDSKASVWRLPGFFNRAGLTCLSNMGSKTAWTAEGNSWIVQRRGPGQEFVLETNGRERETLDWLQELFATT
ncbi:hypothetical protein AYO50_01700 [Acidobacteria bacterium SCGC AG-212-P17]|nr:hypothetical protein AYO50_01700 [Acidobacteria bacterium SCGC AG-212-P17]